MRKILPMIITGLAAISFSAIAQTSASGDRASPGVSDRDGDARTGVMNQGRSVDTQGGQPDSSKAQGRSPVTSTPGASVGATTGATVGGATAGATTGAATTDTTADKPRKAKRHKDRKDGNASSGATRDQEARDKTRAGETSGIGGGTTTTGSGATTTTPGNIGGASTGGGAGR